MTLRNWIRQFDGYCDEMLDKEILIECQNALLVKPEIRLKRKEQYGTNTLDNIEALVIVS